MKRLLILIAALAALSACAPERPPVLASAAQYKSIAIMSAIPAKIELGTTGIFVFDNDSDVVDVPDWHLSGIALDAAKRALAGHYQIAYSMTDDQFYDQDSPLVAMLSKSTSIQDYARQHARADAPVDLIVVLCESLQAFSSNARPEVIQFVGAYKFRDPILTRPPVVHSYILATLMDGRTFKIISQDPLLMPQHKRAGGAFGNGAWGAGGAYPEELMEGFQWKDHWSDLTEDQRNLIHDRIVYLLSTSTFYTLQTTLMAGGS
jgi:hypothetical protein